MAELRFLAQPKLRPELSAALDDHLLGEVRSRQGLELGTLRVYSGVGDLISLGRYHFAPTALPARSAAIQLTRRLSGGRAIAFGDGFLGVSLILPHRSALVSDRADAIAPDQIGNRYARGILEALRSARVASPYYPGRDLILADGRVIGILTFEIDSTGCLLFEVMLALSREFSLSSSFLDQVDREGDIKLQMISPDSSTSIRRATTSVISFEDAAEMIRVGFERQFGIVCREACLDAALVSSLSQTADERFGLPWVAARQPIPTSCRALSTTQLGVVEIQATIDALNVIQQIAVGGDLIANSDAIATLEARLTGCVRTREAVKSVVDETFSRPENFVLGAPPDLITDLILSAS